MWGRLSAHLTEKGWITWSRKKKSIRTLKITKTVNKFWQFFFQLHRIDETANAFSLFLNKKKSNDCLVYLSSPFTHKYTDTHTHTGIKKVPLKTNCCSVLKMSERSRSNHVIRAAESRRLSGRDTSRLNQYKYLKTHCSGWKLDFRNVGDQRNENVLLICASRPVGSFPWRCFGGSLVCKRGLNGSDIYDPFIPSFKW